MVTRAPDGCLVITCAENLLSGRPIRPFVMISTASPDKHWTNYE
jgi:hypothetical protein